MHQKDFGTPVAKVDYAHKFIDPLTSVRLVSELLRDYPDLDDNQRRDLLDLMLNSTDRMIQLIGLMAEAPN